MRRLAPILAIAALALSGCSTPAPEAETTATAEPSTEPSTERDEAAFIEAMEAVNIAGFSETELLDFGDGACKNAADAGVPMADAGAQVIEYGKTEQGADNATIAYITMLYVAAATHLCPEQD